MTPPTKMTTSMITTATAMMTDVVVPPSLVDVGVVFSPYVLVDCVLLLPGTFSVVVIAPTVWRQVVSLEIDAGER